MERTSSARLGGHALVVGAVATTAYWQGEVFAVVWVVCNLPLLFHLLTHPALRRRTRLLAVAEPEQPVIATGPYALVRHPLYSASLLVMLGFSVALGSWWGLVLFSLVLLLIIWRLTNEETYLCAHLRGYQDYCARVTHRLIPFIW